MTEKDRARAEIQKLVERFKQIPEKDRAKFNEAQTRHSFIMPLFRALGWDTENPSEMSAEEQISRGFVDFGFYLNGVPAFYLETKKIQEHLEREQWAKQAMNYSWLRGVTWAVLTHFEGLKVFNAEWQERDPHNAIFLDLTWENYADEHFDDLWLLSKPAIQNGEINRVAERYGKKARKKPVNELLFAQLTTWRRDLFKEMRTYGNLFRENTQLVDDAVQRFLDRLIFIRTVEDRGVEQPRLQPLLRQYKESRKKDKNLFQELLTLFRELDEVYNAQLFAQTHLDVLEIYDWSMLENIINGLYIAPGGYDRYDFNAISTDILGNVYEQYLGFKTIDPAGQIAIEPTHKEVKRKTRGIYYTPQFIVRYIVQQSLGKLLAEGADPYKIRVLDPACGSGSFLIEAFDVLDRHLAQYGTEDHKQHPRKRRLHILQNNIYGVDLDPQAVEVARLNLLVRAASERGLLPMLNNIRVGNSLIDDPDIVGEQAFNWQKEFPEVFADGGFDVIIGNPPYIRIQNLPGHEVAWLNQHYQTPSGNYDIYIPFVERGLTLLNKQGLFGFILPNKFFQANYGKRLREMITQGQHLAEVVHFGDHQLFGDATTYTCILVLSASPSVKFAFAKVENLAGWIEGNGSLKENLNAPEAGTGEWNFVMGTGAALYKKLTGNFTRLGELANIFVGLQTSADKVFILDFLADAGDTLKLHSKSLNMPVEIEKKILHPLVSGTDVQEYIATPQRQYLLFPYRVDFPEAELLSADELSRDYPLAFRYLEANRQALESREGGKFADEKWYRFGRSQNLGIQEQPKLCVPRLVAALHAALDREGFYYLDNVDAGGVTFKSEYQQHALLYLTGLLNSRLLKWYFPVISTPFRGGYLSANRQFLSKLPIRKINFDDPADKEKHDRMVSMVEAMLTLKKEHAAAEAAFEDKRHTLAHKIEQLDRQIDALVYELYGLTDAEIALIEGRS